MNITFFHCILLAFLTITTHHLETNFTFTTSDGPRQNNFLMTHTTSNYSTCTLHFSYTVLYADNPIVIYANTSDLVLMEDLVTTSSLDPTIYNFMDYDHANKGQRQVVQIRKLPVNQTIYIRFLIIGTRQIAFDGLLTIIESNELTNYCKNNAIPKTNSLFCSDCQRSYQGIFCDTQVNHLIQNQNDTFVLAAGGYKLFQLQKSEKMYSFFIQSIKDVKFFILFKIKKNEAAGMLNHWRSASGNGVFETSGKDIDKIYIDTNNNFDVSLGILNVNPIATSITIYYNTKIVDKESQDLVIVILSSFLVMALIATIVLASIVIRKYNTRARFVLVQTDVNQDTLSKQEIERYFPTVLFGQLENKEQSGGCYMKGEATVKDEDNQCVICLTGLKADEPVKVGYCCHVFHDDCLMQWFSVLLNCPYCRQKFTKTNTVALYDALMTKSKKQSLQGLQLIQAILKKERSIKKEPILQSSSCQMSSLQ